MKRMQIALATTLLTVIAGGTAALADTLVDQQQVSGQQQPDIQQQPPLKSPSTDVRPGPASSSIQDQDSFPQSDYLFGDLGGARTKLHDIGIDLSAGFVGELAYNPQGGQKTEGSFADQLSFAVKADLGKLANINGGVFTLNISDRNGTSLSTKAGLNTLMEVQEIFGRGNVGRISELSYAQDLWAGRANVKFGLLDIGDDFASFSCKFQNLTFCYFIPDHMAGDNFGAYPVSQWAARVKLKLTDEVMFKVGVYNIDPKTFAPTGGFSLDTDSVGADTMVELDWTPKFGPNQLAGLYHAGFWYDSARRNDLYLDVNGEPLVLTGAEPQQKRGSFGGWVQGQQQITGAHGLSKDGLSLFFNFLQADKRVVTVDQVINVGLFYTGLLPWRPGDDLGFAVGRSHVSPLVAQGEALQDNLGDLPPVAVQHSEYPTEVYYSINFGKAITIRPNVQYIFDPGGVDSSRNIVVVGVKTILAF